MWIGDKMDLTTVVESMNVHEELPDANEQAFIPISSPSTSLIYAVPDRQSTPALHILRHTGTATVNVIVDSRT